MAATVWTAEGAAVSEVAEAKRARSTKTVVALSAEATKEMARAAAAAHTREGGEEVLGIGAL